MADPEEKALVDKVGWVFPNQESRGTHVNVSGAGVLKNAPHREAAVNFLEYLDSPDAQHYFAEGSNEYAVLEGVDKSAAGKKLGPGFRIDTGPVPVSGSTN